jgi:hypothetical protein
MAPSGLSECFGCLACGVAWWHVEVVEIFDGVGGPGWPCVALGEFEVESGVVVHDEVDGEWHPAHAPFLGGEGERSAVFGGHLPHDVDVVVLG